MDGGDGEDGEDGPKVGGHCEGLACLKGLGTIIIYCVFDKCE